MKYTLLQTLIILIFLSIFAVTDFGFNQQYNNLVNRIEKMPILIFSHDWHLLESIHSDLQDSPHISFISLESNVDILGKMIAEYDLPATDQILDIDQLPNLLHFSFNGNKTSKSEFLQIKEQTETRETGLMIVAEESDLGNLFDLKESISLIRWIFFIGTLIMLCIIALIIRIIAIKKENFFWTIYYRSGGRVNRFGGYFFKSLIATLLPIICFGLLLYFVNRNLLFTYSLDTKSWILILATIMVTMPLAWFITGKD
ncbi:MAG: hypothetical protein K0B81_04210 [Candidatus Cloacimonetes bacterium]|nr:hypothetical protein [Candidatus Cloacimonadota bacterium]